MSAGSGRWHRSQAHIQACWYFETILKDISQKINCSLHQRAPSVKLSLMLAQPLQHCVSNQKISFSGLVITIAINSCCSTVSSSHWFRAQCCRAVLSTLTPLHPIHAQPHPRNWTSLSWVSSCQPKSPQPSARELTATTCTRLQEESVSQGSQHSDWCTQQFR